MQMTRMQTSAYMSTRVRAAPVAAPVAAPIAVPVTSRVLAALARQGRGVAADHGADGAVQVNITSLSTNHKQTNT